MNRPCLSGLLCIMRRNFSQANCFWRKVFVAMTYEFIHDPVEDTPEYQAIVAAVEKMLGMLLKQLSRI